MFFKYSNRFCAFFFLLHYMSKVLYNITIVLLKVQITREYFIIQNKKVVTVHLNCEQ